MTMAGMCIERQVWIERWAKMRNQGSRNIVERNLAMGGMGWKNKWEAKK